MEDVGIEIGPADFPKDPDPDYTVDSATLYDIETLRIPARLQGQDPLQWIFARILATGIAVRGSWYRKGELLLGFNPNSELPMFEPLITEGYPFLAKTTRKSIHPQYIPTSVEKLRIALPNTQVKAFETLLEHAHRVE